MLVLIDTNVLLDALERRDPFSESSDKVLLLCASQKIKGCIALHTISNIFYILRKNHSVENRKRLILGILKFLQVADISHENIRRALERDDFPDFEDCLQDECAAQNCAEYIITRNVKDFINSNIPAVTPSDFLEKHRL